MRRTILLVAEVGQPSKKFLNLGSPLANALRKKKKSH